MEGRHSPGTEALIELKKKSPINDWIAGGKEEGGITFGIVVFIFTWICDRTDVTCAVKCRSEQTISETDYYYIWYVK